MAYEHEESQCLKRDVERRFVRDHEERINVLAESEERLETVLRRKKKKNSLDIMETKLSERQSTVDSRQNSGC